MDFSSSADNTIEMIGHVKLDLSVYSGEDIYSDGDIEDRLLEIARDRSVVEYDRIIEEEASWPVLYHLSSLRENIIEWFPLNKGMKVLEIGSGCGAVTGALAAGAGSVTCCDLSLKRSRINAYRHRYDDNICIHVGNFTDVEKNLDRDFDLICLIGVFEYAQAYMNSEDPYSDFLKVTASHLKKGGSIVIAIENRFGLKYWAGCREDHLGTYFSSLEGYPEGGVVRTFTDRKLKEIARSCGFKDIHMYYPYPDYKFMTDLYSDDRLPRKGELKNNLRNFDRDRLGLFNEKEVFDTIIDEELFSLYSNSYLCVLGPDPGVRYARYSNDRMPGYRIVTEMTDQGDGPVIRKRALCEESTAHLKAMADSYERLNARYSGDGCRIRVNKAKLSDDGKELVFDFVPGVSLESMLDRCVSAGDIDGFASLFDEYIDRISYGEEKADITDIDLIFSNILVDGDEWTIIDYEWTTGEVWPARNIGFRAIYCYILEDERRNKLSMDLIMNKLGIGPELAADLREDEMQFQKRVTGNHRSMAEIRELIGHKVVPVADIAEKPSDEIPLKMKAQIYIDNGSGFSEENSFFAESFPIDADIPFGTKAIRIDPCSDFCLVTVTGITWNGTETERNRFKFKHNGKVVGRDTYAFATSDPGFTISLKGLPQHETNRLHAEMTVTPLDPETAGRF